MIQSESGIIRTSFSDVFLGVVFGLVTWLAAPVLSQIFLLALSPLSQAQGYFSQLIMTFVVGIIATAVVLFIFRRRIREFHIAFIVSAIIIILLTLVLT